MRGRKKSPKRAGSYLTAEMKDKSYKHISGNAHLLPRVPTRLSFTRSPIRLYITSSRTQSTGRKYRVFCWLPDREMLEGKGNKYSSNHLVVEKYWKEVEVFSSLPRTREILEGSDSILLTVSYQRHTGRKWEYFPECLDILEGSGSILMSGSYLRHTGRQW